VETHIRADDEYITDGEWSPSVIDIFFIFYLQY
jgi:hypothetical protein